MRISESRRGAQVTLDILVEALGRVNFGCGWDYKGLTSPDVKLNGELAPSSVLGSSSLCMQAVLAGQLLPLTTLKQCCSSSITRLSRFCTIMYSMRLLCKIIEECDEFQSMMYCAGTLL